MSNHHPVSPALTVLCHDRQRLAAAEALARQLDVPLLSGKVLSGKLLPDQSPGQLAPDGIAVVFGREAVTACVTGNRQGGGKSGEVRAEFVTGKLGYRRHRPQGKPLIARALGIKVGGGARVLDLTAGLGQDGFVLAMLGCRVTLVERHPVVYTLLADGLARAGVAAETDSALSEILARIQLVCGDGKAWLDNPAQRSGVEAVFLDPMFPQRQKSARVNKSMALFHQLVGDDGDGSALLETVLDRAGCRVAVKRPRLAPALSARQPDVVFRGKSVRYDVYLPK